MKTAHESFQDCSRRIQDKINSLPVFEGGSYEHGLYQAYNECHFIVNDEKLEVPMECQSCFQDYLAIAIMICIGSFGMYWIGFGLSKLFGLVH